MLCLEEERLTRSRYMHIFIAGTKKKQQETVACEISGYKNREISIKAITENSLMN